MQQSTRPLESFFILTTNNVFFSRELKAKIIIIKFRIFTNIFLNLGKTKTKIRFSSNEKDKHIPVLLFSSSWKSFKKLEIVLETLNPFDLGDKWNDFDTKLRNDKISVKIK